MKTLEELRKIREKAKEKMNSRSFGKRFKVIVGMGTSGIAMGARSVMKAFIEEISKHNLDDVILSQTGEKGNSSMEPLVDIIEKGKPTITYGNVTPEKVKKIVESHLIKGEPVEEYIAMINEGKGV